MICQYHVSLDHRARGIDVSELARLNYVARSCLSPCDDTSEFSASADEPNLTPEECAGLHLGVRQIAHKMDDVEHEIGPLNWDSIANKVSASLRDATVSAKDAEANFFTALRESKIAITKAG